MDIMLGKSFSTRTHLVFDNDGVQSELIANPEESKPNEELLLAIANFLDNAKERKYSVLSGRTTQFLLSRKGFEDLFSKYRSQVKFFGLYGNQLFDNEHNHVVNESLNEYRVVITSIAEIIKRKLPDELERFNLLKEDDSLNIIEDELVNLVIEDKGFSLGVHLRQLIERLGFGDDNTDQALVKRKMIENLLQDIVMKAIEEVDAPNADLPLKLIKGKSVFEIFPAKESISFDKVDRFKTIYEEHIAKGDCEDLYYFGDDIGDLGILKFCRSIEKTSPGPKLTFVFIDSSTGFEANETEIHWMRENADLVVAGDNQHSAIENLASLVVSKAPLNAGISLNGN